MPCLVGLLALSFPRVILVLVWFFTHYIHRAYHSLLWPLLGLIFMPLTTLAYAWAINTRGSVEGLQLVIVVIAVILDLGLTSSGRTIRRR